MNKLQCLRRIVANLEKKNLQSGTITQDFINKLGFIKGKISPMGYVGIKQGAGEALYRFVNLIYKSARYQGGATFNEFLDEITNVIMIEFLDQQPTSITETGISTVEAKIENWFKSKAVSHRLFIPCAINRHSSNAFSIGPISFTYFNDFIEYQQRNYEKTFETMFGQLLEAMRTEAALWVATAEVLDCTKERAWEIGNLAVDIALAGLQMVIPLSFHPERIARMTARKRPLYTITVSISNDQVNSGVKNEEPGLGMGPGLLDQYVGQNVATLSSVGHRVEAYLSGHSETPKLNQAWCDAAYWFHEGLAEPLDTIAVPKLETAIEVLLRSESSNGSKRRLLKGIKVFYGLDENQLINQDSQLTVKKFVADLITDRSRILHGTWSTLVHHLQDSRPSLTLLVHDLLAQFTVGLDHFISDQTILEKDNIEKFLQWIDDRRQAMLS